MGNDKMDLIKHMALLRNIANDVTKIMSSTAAADFINAAIEIINDYPSEGKLVDTGKSNCNIPDVIKSVCVKCGKPMKDYDKENNNCCDECWLSL